MNLDPLAANYLSNSPYHYSYNNPLRFVDPDGRTIVDKNGNEVKVTFDEDKKGNKTASYEFAEGTKNSVKRKFKRNAGKVIKATINSEKGEELVNAAIESKDNISINLSSKAPSDRLGQTDVNLIKIDGDGNESRDIEVTIFTGTISNLTSSSDISSAKSIVEKRTQNIKNLWKKNKNTFSQKIGGVAGHELHHAAVERGKNVSTAEHQKAYNAEEVILKEFGTKNKKEKK
jgi:hypothetical protein